LPVPGPVQQDTLQHGHGGELIVDDSQRREGAGVQLAEQPVDVGAGGDQDRCPVGVRARQQMGGEHTPCRVQAARPDQSDTTGWQVPAVQRS
jgi:hypothetical protein